LNIVNFIKQSIGLIALANWKLKDVRDVLGDVVTWFSVISLAAARAGPDLISVETGRRRGRGKEL